MPLGSLDGEELGTASNDGCTDGDALGFPVGCIEGDTDGFTDGD